MLPSPTADPVAARIKPERDDHCARFVGVFMVCDAPMGVFVAFFVLCPMCGRLNRLFYGPVVWILSMQNVPTQAWGRIAALPDSGFGFLPWFWKEWSSKENVSDRLQNRLAIFPDC